MARIIKVNRGTGIANAALDRYAPMYAQKGLFGTGEATAKINTVQIGVDAAAVVLAAMAIRELAGPVQFVLRSLYNGVKVTATTAASAVASWTNLGSKNNLGLTPAELQAIQAILAQAAANGQQQTATP